MKKVLITGGHGALGSILSKRLRAKGHEVVCGSRQSPVDASSIQMDFSDPAHLLSVIQATQPELIFHLAATFDQDQEEAFAINVRGAMHLLGAMRLSDNAACVVLAGTAAEYGLVVPSENPLREDRVLRPVTTYGLTKSWQTTWGLMRAHQGDDIVVARIFNLWGPGLSDRLFAGRVEHQIRQVLNGSQGRIEVGPLTAVRDYISLNDAASQLIAIAEHGGSGRVFHVASGQPISMRDLLTKYLEGSNLDFGIVDEHALLTNRAGYDVPVIYADITETEALIAKSKNDPC